MGLEGGGGGGLCGRIIAEGERGGEFYLNHLLQLVKLLQRNYGK